MKKTIVSIIIILCCILFYKNADAAVISGMDGKTGIVSVITAQDSISGEKTEIKNLVSVIPGQGFNLSQISNSGEILEEGGTIGIENLTGLTGFPDGYSYNPGAVSVTPGEYIIEAKSPGLAVLKITAVMDSVSSICYFAINCISGDMGAYNTIYNAIENIDTHGAGVSGISSFNEAYAIYPDYHEASLLIDGTTTFYDDINIQHDGVENIWKITNGYKYTRAKKYLNEYFNKKRLYIPEVRFISEYEGIVLRFGRKVTEDDILAYSFYRKKDYETDAGITLKAFIKKQDGSITGSKEFTVYIGESEVKLKPGNKFKARGKYIVEVQGTGIYTSTASYEFKFIFKSINKGAFVKKKTVIYSGIYKGIKKGTAIAKSRYRCVADSSAGWLKIRLPDGTKGYIKKKNVSLSEKAIANIVNIYDKKYSYSDLSRDIKKMARFYQDVMKLSVAGITADNNKIYCIRLGSENAKKKVLIQSAMHAREWLNSQLVMKMTERCCKSYYSGKYGGVPYRQLFNKVCFYIVPMLNPDGVSISQYGLAGIKSASLRKFARRIGKGRYSRWKANARGVDLNRNFATGFKKGNSRGTRRGPEGYSGPYACSEKETKALLKLVNKTRPDAVINYHEAGRVIYYTRDSSLKNLIRQKTGYQPVRESISGANGSFGDFLTKKGITWCTPETCTGTAPVSHTQFYYEWGKHRDMIQAVAKLYQK